MIIKFNSSRVKFIGENDAERNAVCDLKTLATKVDTSVTWCPADHKQRETLKFRRRTLLNLFRNLERVAADYLLCEGDLEAVRELLCKAIILGKMKNESKVR